MPTVKSQTSLNALRSPEPAPEAEPVRLTDDGELHAPQPITRTSLIEQIIRDWRRALPGGLFMAWIGFSALRLLSFDMGAVLLGYLAGTASVLIVTVGLWALLTLHNILRQSPLFARFLAHTLYIDVDRRIALGAYAIPSFIVYLFGLLQYAFLGDTSYYGPSTHGTGLLSYALVLPLMFALGAWFCTRPRKQKKIKRGEG